MTKPSPSLVQVLTATITQLLPTKPTAGNMAFIRCLPPSVSQSLAATPEFQIPDWEIAVVMDHADSQARAISTDQAVALREDKAKAILLLIEPQQTGSGMDGIYSAAREIAETELFDCACKIARNGLPKGGKTFADKAISKAKRVHNYIAPWQKLEYLCAAIGEDRQLLGTALTTLGLWPIKLEPTTKLDDAQLDVSASILEKLLPKYRGLTAENRVNSLCLPENEQAISDDLIQWLRKHDQAAPGAALAALQQQPQFWLQNLHPQFHQQALSQIELVSWLGRTQQPLKWSGLILGADTRLEFVIDKQQANSKKNTGLHVRWKVTPPNLAKGAAEYQIQIQAGNDILAEKSIIHTGAELQKTVFTVEDFEELDDNAKFEARVVIRALGDTPCEQESLDFILYFGERKETVKIKSSGKIYSSLIFAIVHLVTTRQDFDELITKITNGSTDVIDIDKKGYISCRWKGKLGRVFCPPLLSALHKDWQQRQGQLGRWRQTIRPDGVAVGPVEFISIPESDVTEILAQTSQAFSLWLQHSQGPLGMIYLDDKVLVDYINAAAKVWKNCDPQLALIQTLEVVSLTGARLGIIVLPTHPLRVAWQQSFDTLVKHHVFEEKISALQAQELLQHVTGSHCPAFLPGFDVNSCFIFADTLGPHAAALVAIDDPEPKATVALLASFLLNKEYDLAPSIGQATINVLATEIKRYLSLHPEYNRLQIHAIHSGDAMPVVRALGKAQLQDTNDNFDLDTPNERQELCYQLDLYSSENNELSGQFIANITERRRNGSTIDSEDYWLAEVVERPGGVILPKLQWFRRLALQPETPAHLALAFDLFTSKVECQPKTRLPSSGSLEVHGLLLVPNREFIATTDQFPYWCSFIPYDPVGEKHPVAKVLTIRQVRLHNILLDLTVQHLGGTVGTDWPVLITEVNAKRSLLLQNLHALCDWVITADRNAGVEYFDSPQGLPKLYDAYVIDCAPERDDLGFLQLITSTNRLEEIADLLGTILKAMASPIRRLNLTSTKVNCNAFSASILTYSRSARRSTFFSLSSNAGTSSNGIQNPCCKDNQVVVSSCAY
ncbi:hypothetical protein TI04_07105 [Achromatium sp. WMS2]|nr:hypothetical protein TI04_07105 [Achromatium sp. WMS2]